MAEQQTAYEAPKSLAGKGYSKTNQKRIEQDEAELEELLKANAPKGENEEGKEPEEEKELSAEEKSFKKRYGDLRRYHSAQVKELEEKIEALKRQPSNQPPVSEEELEKWMKENPKIARIVESIADRKANEKFQDANSRLSKLDEEKMELMREKAEATIRKSHKDFDAIRESDEFHEWAETQPKWVQDAVYENADDPASVIRVLDLYKLDVKSRGRDIDSARDVGARGTPATPKGKDKEVYSESRVARMSMHEYAKHEEKINEALANGTFVYDMSAARNR